MRSVFTAKPFQGFGGSKPIAGQKLAIQGGRAGNAVPLRGQAPAGAQPAKPAVKPPSMPGKGAFGGDCPVCHH